MDADTVADNLHDDRYPDASHAEKRHEECGVFGI